MRYRCQLHVITLQVRIKQNCMFEHDFIHYKIFLLNENNCRKYLCIYIIYFYIVL